MAFQLKQIRKRRKLSQEELGLKAGISQSHLSALEKKKKQPTLTILEKLKDALNVSIAELTGEDVAGEEGKRDRID
jgi:transcriptional regulator with XRE-family HTH domain